MPTFTSRAIRRNFHQLKEATGDQRGPGAACGSRELAWGFGSPDVLTICEDTEPPGRGTLDTSGQVPFEAASRSSRCRPLATLPLLERAPLPLGGPASAIRLRIITVWFPGGPHSWRQWQERPPRARASPVALASGCTQEETEPWGVLQVLKADRKSRIKGSSRKLVHGSPARPQKGLGQ